MAFKRSVTGTAQLAKEIQHYVPEDSVARIEEILRAASSAILIALLKGKQVDFNHFKLYAIASEVEINGVMEPIPVLKAVLSRSGREILSQDVDILKEIRDNVRASRAMYQMSKDITLSESDTDITKEELELLSEGITYE